MSEDNATVDANDIDTTNDDDATASDDGATFTKADVEEMMRKRLAKFSDYEDLKTELTDLRSQVESGSLVEEAVNKAKAEAIATVTPKVVKAEAKAMAAEMGFYYPSDAHLYIDMNDVKIEGDEIDLEALKGLLEGVVEKRPNLVRSEETVTRTEAGLGVRGKAPKKSTSQQFAEAIESL